MSSFDRFLCCWCIVISRLEFDCRRSLFYTVEGHVHHWVPRVASAALIESRSSSLGLRHCSGLFGWLLFLSVNIISSFDRFLCCWCIVISRLEFDCRRSLFYTVEGHVHHWVPRVASAASIESRSSNLGLRHCSRLFGWLLFLSVNIMSSFDRFLCCWCIVISRLEFDCRRSLFYTMEGHVHHWVP